MSAFWNAFHKGEIGRLTDEELDSLSRGLTPMVYGKRKGPSWASARGRWIVPERGTIGYNTGRARRVIRFGAPRMAYARSFRVGRDRSGGYWRSGNNLELKFLDQDIAGTFATAGLVTNAGSLINIAQGTGENQRDGRKCTIKRLSWKLNLIKGQQTGSANTATLVRCIIYLDKQCNGATVAVTDLLEVAEFDSFRNLANNSRFQILSDRTLPLNSIAGGGDGTTEDYGKIIKQVRWNKNCSIPVEYSSTAGAITEIRSNNIGCLMIADTTSATYTGTFRVRFTG